MCQEPPPARCVLHGEIITPDYFGMETLSRVLHPGWCCAGPFKGPFGVLSFHHSCITRPSVSLGVLSNCLGCILSFFFFFLLCTFPFSLSSHRRLSVTTAFIRLATSSRRRFYAICPSPTFRPPALSAPLCCCGSAYLFISARFVLNLEDDSVEFLCQRAGWDGGMQSSWFVMYVTHKNIFF